VGRDSGCRAPARPSNATDAVTLANARAEAKKLRESTAQGHDPLAERRHAVAVAAASKTFDEAARTVIKRDKGAWWAHTLGMWERSLFDHAKKLVPMDVAEIEIEHILEILQPLWDRGFHQGPLDVAAHRDGSRHGDCAQMAHECERRQLEGIKHVAPKRSGGDDKDRRRPMTPREEAPAVAAKIRDNNDTIAAP